MLRTNNKLANNAMLNIIKQISTLAFQLITFPYVSRVLGKVNYGKYSWATSIIEYFFYIAGFGISTYAIRECARIRDDRKKTSDLCSELFSLNLITTILAYIILLIFTIFWKKMQGYRTLIFILSFRIIATTIGVEWVYTIYEDYLNITIRQIVTQVVGLMLTLLLVRQRDDYVLYALATVIAMSGANLFNFFYSKKYIDLHITIKVNIVKYFRPLLMIFFYSIMVIIYSSSDITMLGLLSDDSHVGIYSVASKIYGLAKNIFIAALVPLIPRVAYYLGNNKMEDIKRLVQKTLDIMLFLVLPGLLLMILYSKNIILLLCGTEYIDAFRPLQLLSIALLFALCASIFTSAIMIPNRQEKEVTIITIISATSNIILNLLLIPWIQENGAAITTIIAEAIVCIVSGLYCRKYFKLSEIGHEIIYIILGCLGIIACNFIVNKIIYNPIGQMFIGGFSSIIVYLCLMFFINRRLVEEIKNQYFKK